MSRPNAEHALPPGDRDVRDVPPALDLEIDAIDRAIEDANVAHADLKLARRQVDWPKFEAAAHRLAGATKHLATAITAARRREPARKEEKV
jgi:hypothetical protein